MWETEGIIFPRQKFHATKGVKYKSQLPIAGYDEYCSLNLYEGLWTHELGSSSYSQGNWGDH